MNWLRIKETIWANIITFDIIMGLIFLSYWLCLKLGV